MARKIKVYTDGACSGNPGPGGWGVVIVDGEEIRKYNGGDPETTNNKMELQAAINAVKLVTDYAWDNSIEDPVSIELYTDSRYVVGGVNGWVKKWRCNGWKTSAGQPVKNKEKWEELADVLKGRDIRVLKVKGHVGDLYNEMADDLAVEAAKVAMEGCGQSG